MQGPCPGDSGGPLYIGGVKDDNGDITGQTLAGIHSGGLGCGGLNVPAFWQRVRKKRLVLLDIFNIFINITYW